MAEEFLLPSFKEQRALKLENDKKNCLEFIKKFIRDADTFIKNYNTIYFYEDLPFFLEHKLMIPLFKKHHKKYYIDLRNKGWYLKLEYIEDHYQLNLRKANLLNRASWGLRNFALKFEKLYLGG